jgi:beta-lactam-binding protein with PASTA domain
MVLFAVSRVEGTGSNPAVPAGETRASGGTAAQPSSTRQPAAQPAGTMPNLVGTDIANAQQQLLSKGITPLVLGVVSSNRTDRPNSVLRQQPSPGTTITTNSNVTLTIAIAQGSQAPAASATAPARLPSTTPRATPRVP